MWAKRQMAAHDAGLVSPQAVGDIEMQSRKRTERQSPSGVLESSTGERTGGANLVLSRACCLSLPVVLA